MSRWEYDDAAANRSNAWVPADMGYKAWSLDPGAISNTFGMVSGTLYVVGLLTRTPLTLSTVTIGIGTGGTTLTAGQCLAGVYQNGQQLAATADQSSGWASAGRKDMALAASASVAAGMFYVALLANGTTPPQLFRGGASTVSNSGTVSRAATAGTGLTALPATLGSITQIQPVLWAAVA